VIQMLLQTGRFGESAANATLLALRMFALGLLGHVTLEIVARMYYAQQDTLTPLAFNAAAMVLNITLAALLVGPLAHAGLALANSIAVTAEVLLALAILRRRLGGPGSGDLASAVTKSALASAVMGVAIWLTLALLPDSLAAGPLAGPFVAGLLTVSVGAAVGLAVYLAVGWWVGIAEIRRAGMLARRAVQARRS